MNVSVVGLGKLGAPLAAVLASKGHRVVGVDVDPRVVRLLNEGQAPVFEPGLAELVDRNRDRLSATVDCGEAIARTDATFIIVPTPTDANGGFSLRYVLAAAEAIGRALRHKDGFHLVMLTSTVMPGATGNEVLPALQSASHKQCGVHFGLCYNPEFIALGSVIRDMLNPDMILIGESDVRSGDLLARVYRELCDNKPPIVRMNFVNAELTKLAVNTFVTTKISYANMLAEVCEHLDGADVDVVTAALGRDSRIGGKYLKGALGYGGPCFPRDNIAFSQLARQVGVRATLADATHETNRHQIERLASAVLARLAPGGRVAILGLAYKPETDVVEESQGVELARRLVAQEVEVVVYDPAALENGRRVLGEGVVFASSAAACVHGADVVVVTTAWEEFRNLSPADFQSAGGRASIVDCWRLFDASRFAGAADYVTLGVGEESRTSGLELRPLGVGEGGHR